MFKKLRQFIKKAAKSRIGLLLFLAHTFLVVFAFIQRSWEMGNTPFHFTYEPILLQALLLVNFPVMLISVIIQLPFLAILSATETYAGVLFVRIYSDYIGITVVFICASVQWWLIGFGIEQVVLRNKGKLK